MKYVQLAADGETVIAAGNSPHPPDDAVIVDTPLTPHEMTMCLLVDEAFVPRPRIDPPANNSGTFSLQGLPLGTKVQVFDLVNGEEMLSVETAQDDETVSFTLADPGQYAVEAQTPFPWIRENFHIEVTP